MIDRTYTRATVDATRPLGDPDRVTVVTDERTWPVLVADPPVIAADGVAESVVTFDDPRPAGERPTDVTWRVDGDVVGTATVEADGTAELALTASQPARLDVTVDEVPEVSATVEALDPDDLARITVDLEVTP